MDSKGYIFITGSGYDPEKGKHVKDPTLEGLPSLGACMPNIRKHVNPGDQIICISGKIPNLPQFIMCAFEVAETMPASEAYKRFPENRLREMDDGQLTGNVIVGPDGTQHFLDKHKNFDKRLSNFVTGKNEIVLCTPDEIARGRVKTMEILCEIFGKAGRIPRDIIGRMSKLNSDQINTLRAHLMSLKDVEKPLVRRASVGSIITPGTHRSPQIHRPT